MDFNEAIGYVTAALKFGINPGLEKISAACALLGNPQERFPVVQVTGTNGKTSVSRFAAAVLQACGLKTGLYTSPHLSSYTERIAVDGVPISEADFGSMIGAAAEALNRVSVEMGELTEFEILTAGALDHFAREQVAAAVLEVGLGGRWDATSVTKPKISVITNVELDHTDRLGDTRAAIAWDKAHIVKEGSLAIVGDLHPEALAVVVERCRAVGADYMRYGRDFTVVDSRSVGASIVLSVDGLFGSYRGLVLRTLGEFQRINAALAIAAAEAFIQGPLSEGRLAKALNEVSCPGRMEIISDEPVVLVDGAHNPAGMRRLVDSLKESFGDRRLVVILSVSSDKDARGVLEEVRPVAETLILAPNASLRSASADELSALAAGRFIVEQDLGLAMERAVAMAAEDGVVVITGSLYAVGEARGLWAVRSLS